MQMTLLHPPRKLAKAVIRLLICGKGKVYVSVQLSMLMISRGAPQEGCLVGVYRLRKIMELAVLENQITEDIRVTLLESKEWR